jgi:hypothetical protein
MPIISSSPDLFDGNHFVSFSTSDKDTGVYYYEYAPTWILRPGDADWKKVESPLPFSNIEKFQKIYIRAVDYERNYRAVSTAGPYRSITLILSSIILVCACLALKRYLRSVSS